MVIPRAYLYPQLPCLPRSYLTLTVIRSARVLYRRTYRLHGWFCLTRLCCLYGLVTLPDSVRSSSTNTRMAATLLLPWITTCRSLPAVYRLP